MPIAIALEIYGTKINDDGDTLRKELEIYDSFFDFNDSLKLITNPSLTDTAAALTLITLDKTSSDFDQFLGWTPENIYMNMSMVANPDLPADSILVFFLQIRFPIENLTKRHKFLQRCLWIFP